jgi:hypothetical protein
MSRGAACPDEPPTKADHPSTRARSPDVRKVWRKILDQLNPIMGMNHKAQFTVQPAPLRPHETTGSGAGAAGSRRVR